MADDIICSPYFSSQLIDSGRQGKSQRKPLPIFVDVENPILVPSKANLVSSFISVPNSISSLLCLRKQNLTSHPRRIQTRLQLLPGLGVGFEFIWVAESVATGTEALLRGSWGGAGGERMLGDSRAFVGG